MNQLVRALKENREQKGISKYRLAQISGLDKTGIGRIEEGDQNPTLYSLLKMAQAQEVKIVDLLEGLED